MSARWRSEQSQFALHSPLATHLVSRSQPRMEARNRRTRYIIERWSPRAGAVARARRLGAVADLTYQAFPNVTWQFTKWGSLQLGYRWIYANYETGSGTDRFKYDVLTQGPQLGVTFIF